MKHLFWSAVLLGSALGAAAASFENLLVKNGTELNQVWPKKEAVATVEKGRLTVKVPFGSSCNGNVPLKPEWKFLRLDMEMRTVKLIPGAQNWQCGRMGMRFYGADGQPVGPWPEIFGMSGTNDWTYRCRVYAIPEGAVRLAIDPSNFGAGGTVEFRNVQLTAHRTRAEADKPYDGLRLPPVEVLWGLSDAERTVNPHRERITLNSIWQFKPVENASPGRVPPASEYPYFFKVPGIWPGYNGWKQPGSSQEIYEPSGRPAAIDGTVLNHVWYRRTVDIPENWKGRRIELEFTYIQTCAQLFIDGKKAGEFFFPGGCIDISSFVQPGKRHELALLAAELVGKLDPTRPVYHHESGNLGPMYTINCYLNWAPSQERSDWLEHWEKNGVKPLFLMEWGLPHNPSWSSFRGPAFIWGADAVQCIGRTNIMHSSSARMLTVSTKASGS